VRLLPGRFSSLELATPVRTKEYLANRPVAAPSCPKLHFQGEPVKPSCSSPRRILLAALLAASLTLGGCVPVDADYSKAVTSFQASANTLTQAYLVLLNNENAAAATDYLDSSISRSRPITGEALVATARVTPEQIKNRTQSITALTAYMTALASFASGAPATKLQTDATAAKTCVTTLTASTGLSGPVSAAFGAMTDVLDLIAKHAGERAVHDSIAANKDKVAALFALIEREASDTYTVQKTFLDSRQSFMVRLYNQAATPSADPAVLLAAADRVTQAQKDAAAFAAADPAPAIAAFKKAYDALNDAVLGPKEKKKESFTAVLAAIEAFQTAVAPLQASAVAVAKTL
jgi:hypothetical protein